MSSFAHRSGDSCSGGVGRTLARGLSRRCPACGERDVFAKWGRLRPSCPRCGLRLEREAGAFLGAFVVNFAVMELAVGAVLAGYIVASAAGRAPPLGWALAGGAAVAVLMPLAFYPRSKTLWLAVDLLMQRASG